MIVVQGDQVVLLVVPLDNRVVGNQPFQGVPSTAVPMVVLLHLGVAPAVDLGNLGDNFAAGHLENPDNHRDPGVHRADRENFHTRADRPYPGAGVAVDHTVVDTDFVDSVGLDDHEDRPSYHPNQVPFHLLVAILTSLLVDDWFLFSSFKMPSSDSSRIGNSRSIFSVLQFCPVLFFSICFSLRVSH